MAGSPPVSPTDLLPHRPQSAPEQGDSAGNGRPRSPFQRIWIRLRALFTAKSSATDTALQSTPRARALRQMRLATEQNTSPSERQLEPGELRQRLLDAVSDVESYQRHRLHTARRKAP